MGNLADAMTPAYRVLGVLEAGQVAGALYPVLNDRLTPEFESEDGDANSSFEVRGIYLRDIQDDKLHIVNGSGDLKATLWISDQRLVLVCPNYDKVRWDAGNNFGVMQWGLSIELTDHVASKIYHRVRSRNKAMATHLYFPWIASVMWSNDRGRKNPPTLRIEVVRNLTTGQKQFFLEIGLPSGTDAGAIAQCLLRRIGRWYLDGPLDLNDKGVTAMTELANVGALPRPAEGSLSFHKIPTSYSVSATTIPAALAVKAAETHKAAAEKRAAAERGRERALVFRTRSAESLPPSELVTVPEAGADKYESPLGVLVESTKRLWPVASEELRFHAWGQLRCSVRVDDTGAPSRSSEKVVPLCQGIGQLLVTDQRIALAVTQGISAAGGVAPRGPVMFIVVMPIAEVTSIEMAPATDVPGHVGPDLVIKPKDSGWGAIWISSVGAELKNTADKWVAERKEGDLGEIATRLSAMVSKPSARPVSSLSDEAAT